MLIRFASEINLQYWYAAILSEPQMLFEDFDVSICVEEAGSHYYDETGGGAELALELGEDRMACVRADIPVYVAAAGHDGSCKISDEVVGYQADIEAFLHKIGVQRTGDGELADSRKAVDKDNAA
jgi:hypothetical protein